MKRGLCSGLAVAVFAGLSIWSSGASAAPTPEQLTFFETRIRPVLADNCYSCHGREKQRSELRLDHINFIRAGGARGPAVVPGDVAGSRLITAIKYEDVKLQMPPTGKLSDEQIADLERWVQMGAVWPEEPEPAATAAEPGFDIEKRKREHWVWQPIRPHTPPAVKRKDWVRDPIDAFILAKLEEAEISPAPPADRRDLIRRVYLDLIGLPPTPEAVEAFVNDTSPDAYEKVVDELLASPHFGEKWARHWMDLVRYAETYGHEFDYPVPEAWRYRDYLIRAFNSDVPYDLFLMEHIAGDLLPQPRMHPTEGYNESIIGTGFWFFHQATHAPVDVRMDTAERVDNQIDVMTKTFLGLTVACARCHDHKFDAISQADFYAIAGFIQSSRQQTALLDQHGKIGAARDELRSHLTAGQKALDMTLAAVDRDELNRIDRYLAAAREVLYGKTQPDDKAVPSQTRPDIVFDDFEAERFDPNRWIVDGAAFAVGPVAGTQKNQQPVKGFTGQRLVNTYLGNDRMTGRLTSKPFTIERRYVRLLVGGGAHHDQTCVNLRIDGQVVHTVTGKNSEELVPVVWDVRPFAGREAVLEIVDSHSGGWGHILVDDIVFTDQPVTPTLLARPIAAVAKELDLDADLLSRWVAEMMAATGPDHPLYPLRELARLTQGEGQPFAEARAKLAKQFAEHKSRAEAKEGDRVFETFDRSDWGDWFVTGWAFGDGPTRAGQWTGRARGTQMLSGGIAHSGTIAPRLQGVLRSPTFVLDSDYILYRMAGRKGQIRLIIENYQMDVFNALLFEGMSFAVDTNDRYVWHVQDVSRYRGTRAHIELIDHGDGYVAVDEIRFSNNRTTAELVNELAWRIVAGEPPQSLDAMDQRYANAIVEALRHHAAGQLNEVDAMWLDTLCVGELLPTNGVSNDATAALHSHARAIEKINAAIPEPMRITAMADGPGIDEHFFIRGSPHILGPVIPRRFLEALGGTQRPPIGAHTSGRLELAQAMLDENNPLPARVMVNRVWHHLFGVGIVPTTDDFGVLGQPPSHPELLDHLAYWYRNDANWSTKQLIRKLVLSNTYRMSSRPSDERAEQVDPTNTLLHRMRIRRMTGEVLRDTILAVSGRLDRTMYGPSVPIHLTPFMDGRGRPAQSGPLDGAGRRSVYIEVRRNFLSPMMQAFDMPTPFTTIGRRTMSNVPAQALILMNDPFVVEQAKLWAKRVLADNQASPEARIEGMYLRAFGRPPTTAQRNAAIGFLKLQAQTYGIADNGWQHDERVWTDLCHVMFNVKDFAFVN